MKKILVEICHPNDLHQFRALYDQMSSQNISFLFALKDKDIVLELAKAYNFPYIVLGKTPVGITRKILSIIFFDFKLLCVALKFKPDIFLSRVSPHSGHVSWFLRKIHIGFADTEHVAMLDRISIPFVDVLITSSSYRNDWGSFQIRYPGYIESWYLHPKRFVPKKPYNILQIPVGTKYAVIRFVSWQSHHDNGITGFSIANKIRLVKELSKHVRVFISSEAQLPEELSHYSLLAPKDRMHDILAYASLFIGESATMASECAMLGTPSIYTDDFHLGYIDEMVHKYQVITQFSLSEFDQNAAITKAVSILANPDYQEELKVKNQQMLNEIIEPVSFVSWFITNYPESFNIVKDDPTYVLRFK